MLHTPQADGSPRFLRAVVLGCVLSVLTGLLNVRNMMVTIGTFLAYDASTSVAVYALFILGLVNVFLQKRFPRLAFSPAELLLIFSMLIVANVLPTFGLVMRIIPIITGLTYFSTPENGWQEIIAPHVNRWVIMRDSDAVRKFYEGLPKGETIPWASWFGVLGIWTVFFIASFFFILALVVLFRRHWSERERLPYPLTQLPLAIAGERGSAPFYADRLLWLGIAIPLILGTVKGLHWHFPIVPDLVFFKHIPIFRNTTTITVWISFTALGITYFMGQDLAFSIWFFRLVLLIEQGVFNITGVSPRQTVAFGEGMVGAQSAGAFLAFVIVAVWESRASISEFVSAARRGKRGDEILSPRATLFCLGLCGLFIIGFFRFCGIHPLVSVLFLLTTAMVFIGIAKAQALGGHVTGSSPASPISAITTFAGTRHLPPSTIVGFGLMNSGNLSVEAITVNAAKLAEKRRWNGMFPAALLLGFLCCLLSSYWLVLKLGYATGAMNAHAYLFRSQPMGAWNNIREFIKYPASPELQSVAFLLSGGLTYFFLAIMRFRLIWWPFHPLGFACASTYFVTTTWFSVFLGWLAKTLILRYAGVPTFRKMKGFFFGLFLGQILCNTTWVLIDMAVRMRGNDIFWW